MAEIRQAPLVIAGGLATASTTVTGTRLLPHAYGVQPGVVGFGLATATLFAVGIASLVLAGIIVELTGPSLDTEDDHRWPLVGGGGQLGTIVGAGYVLITTAGWLTTNRATIIALLIVAVVHGILFEALRQPRASPTSDREPVPVPAAAPSPDPPPQPSPPDDGTDSTDDPQSIDPASRQFHWTDDTGVTMADVGGLDDVKATLEREVIAPFRRREELRERGLHLQAGNVLLYGQPGTGKSHLAKALATELDVPAVILTSGDITSKFVNESAQRVADLFREAEAVAEEAGGAVVFIDELDSLLAARDGGHRHHAEDTKTLNTYLAKIEELGPDILFIGSTNRLHALDKAAIRSGRVDLTIELPVPDLATRKAILTTLLREVPHNLTTGDVERVARATEKAVAADLAALIDRATRIAVFDRDGDRVTLADITEALTEG